MTTQFKRYQCHKQVDAAPMTRGQAARYLLRDDLNDGDPQQPGYVVVYQLGTAEEYLSWSPATVFESGYREIEAATPSPGT